MKRKSRWIAAGTARDPSLLRRLPARDEPDADDNAVRENVRGFAPLVRLVFCFAHELGLDRFCARDLGGGAGKGVPGRTG